ncbi:MucR family transcriptional regulator [Acuticoccus sp. M5D2P5]|uniref:MucR family transcriptional regulator n=1 Tax=Acuticoccus kalidii TaxID=2910977 RepID=UPI001F428380|nr:MucR family transcriptional regulator [Acuticoccus kalidii]MCF3933317.1 MucR family transcriptional regulator [Acuticoccus kalidii]
MPSSNDPTRFIDLTAEIVAAYVANNSVQPHDIQLLITDVHGALENAVKGMPEPEPLKPAVLVRKSVTPDHLVCLEDGRTYKSLKRHLQHQHNMTPAEYRERWGLPTNYPMVAPNYASARSDLAKRAGFGRKAVEPQTKTTRRGRPKTAKASAASPK